MADKIDELQIEISSSANSAEKAIDSLAKSLSGLMRSLSNVSPGKATKGMSDITSEIQKQATGLKKAYDVTDRGAGQKIKSDLESIAESIKSGNYSIKKQMDSLYETLKGHGRMENPYATDMQKDIKEWVKANQIRLPKSDFKRTYGKDAIDIHDTLMAKYTNGNNWTEMPKYLEEMNEQIGTQFDTTNAENGLMQLYDALRKCEDETISFSRALSKGLVNEGDLWDGIVNATSAINEAVKKERELSQGTQELAGTENVFQTMAVGIKTIGDAIGSIHPENLANLATVLKSLDTKSGVANIAKGLQDAQQAITGTTEKTKELEGEMSSTSEVSSQSASSFGSHAEEVKQEAESEKSKIQELIETIREYKKTISGMEKGDIAFNEEKYKNAFVGLQDAQKQLSDYKEGILVARQTTEEVQKETSAVTLLIQRMKELKALMSGMDKGDISFDPEKYSAANAELEESKAILADYKKSLTELPLETKMLKEALTEPLDELAKKAKETDLTPAVKGGFDVAALKEGFETATHAIEIFRGVCERAQHTLTSLLKIASIPLKQVSNEFREKFEGMKETVSGFTKRFEATLSKLPEFMNKVWQRFTFTLLRKAINAVITDLNSAVESLRAFTGTVGQEFNASLTSIQSNLKMLGGNIVGAFAPLINAVAPIIDFIVSKLIAAIQVINQFFAALTGRSSYAVPKMAKGLGGYAGAANKAAKAQDKLNASVLAFDELNKLNGDNDSGSGGGGGGGGGAGGLEWEEMPVNPKIKEWADKLKKILADLFEPLKKAWDIAGQYVIDGFKYMVDELWKLAKDMGRDFLTVWKQDETVAMFVNILKIIGDIERVVGNLARNFRKAWNENKVGLHILEKIRDIFAILIDHIHNVTDYMVGWSDKIDFSPLLNSINELLDGLKDVADFLGGVFEDIMKNIVLEHIRYLIEEGLPHLNKKIKEVIDAFDFEKIRNDLKPLWDAIENVLKAFHEGFANAIGNIGNALAKLTNSEVFTTFLENVANLLNRISPDLVEKVLTGLGYAIIGIANALMQFFNSDLFQNFINWLFDKLDGMTAEQIAQGITNIALSILRFKFAEFIAGGAVQFLGFMGKLIAFKNLGSIASDLGKVATNIGKVGTAVASNGGASSLEAWSSALSETDTVASTAATGGIAKLIGKFSLLYGAVMAVVLVGRELAKFFETIRGGNGELTELKGFENLADRIRDIGHLTSEQANSIYKVIESYETGQMSLADTASTLVQMFKDMGVSEYDASAALQELYTNGQITEGVFNAVKANLDQLGEGLDKASTSALNSSTSIDALKENYKAAAVEAGANVYQLAALEAAFRNQDGSEKTAEEAYNSLIAKMKEMGLDTNTFIEALNEQFPNAVNTSADSLGNLEGSVDNTMKSVSDSVTSYSELYDGLTKLRDQGDITSQQFVGLQTELNKQKSAGVSASDAYDEVLSHMQNMSDGSSTAMGTMQSNVSEAFESIIKDAQEKGGEVDKSFGKGITDNVEETKRPIDQFGRTTVEAMHDSAWRFGSPSQTAIDFGKDVVDGFNQGIEQNAQSSDPVIQAWLQGLVDKVTQFSESLGVTFESTGTVVQTFTDSFTLALEGMNTSLESSNTIIQTFVTGFTTSLLQIETSLQMSTVTIQTFATSVNASFAMIDTGVQGKLTAMSSAVNASFQSMKTTIQTAVQGTSTVVSNVYNQMKTNVTTVLSGMQSTITQRFTAMSNAVKTKMNAMKSTLSNDFNNMKARASSTMAAMVSDVSSKLNQMDGKFKALNLSQTGNNVMQGFWNGMKQVFPSILAWAQDAANQIASTFASAMQIGSPSKLFESFGEFTLEGYMIGVKKKLPESIKLIDSWGDDISNAYNANTMGMSGNIDISASSSEFAGTIINGVYEAVAAAMENHSQEVTVYSELRTDDEALARAVTRGQKSLNRRYKTV